MPCVADCLATNQCGPIRRPQPGAVYSPYVKITMATANITQGPAGQAGTATPISEGVALTVGNESNPATGNHACIKSFQYGASNGQGCEVEIIDEQGSEFSKFMDNLSQSIDGARADYKMFVDFGWIIRNCNGGSISRNWVSDNGGRLCFMPMTIDATYEKGMIKFKLIARDMLDRVSENRADVPQGDDRQKKRLVRAIRDVFSRTEPAINNVQFLRQTDQGPVPFGFKNSDGGREGPLGTWPADQQNALAAARKWLTSLTTDRNKGIRPCWDCSNPEPTIIFWEDGMPSCNENGAGCERTIATYIVNGGDCSPVISFNPKVQWVFAANNNSGGGTGGGTSQRTVRTRTSPNEGGPGSLRPCRQVRNDRPVRSRTGGVQTQIPPPQNDLGWRPPDLIVPRLQQAMAAHMGVAGRYEELGAIECELKIQGDPRYVHPPFWNDKFLSIIVINPFHIFASGTNCGDWLAQPSCNSIFSQKEYLITGVSHEIKEGSYTTTIKVKKPNPLTDNPLIQPLPGT